MNKKICIILIGAPCSGKSVIGKSVAQELGFKYISSGDIARKIASKSADAATMLNNGEMAPEDKMRSIIYAKLIGVAYDNKCNGVILDGFPRFGDQATWLRISKLTDKFIMRYVMITAPESILSDRANARHRFDDGNFGKRYRYFREVTLKDLRYYINYVISNSGTTITECSKLLVTYIKEGLDVKDS